MIRGGQVAHVGMMGDLTIDEKTILKCIPNKWGIMMCPELIWVWIRKMASSYKHSNKLPGSIKGGEFPGKLSDSERTLFYNVSYIHIILAI
jgi:hypothetical protein